MIPHALKWVITAWVTICCQTAAPAQAHHANPTNWSMTFVMPAHTKGPADASAFRWLRESLNAQDAWPVQLNRDAAIHVTWSESEILIRPATELEQATDLILGTARFDHGKVRAAFQSTRQGEADWLFEFPDGQARGDDTSATLFALDFLGARNTGSVRSLRIAPLLAHLLPPRTEVLEANHDSSHESDHDADFHGCAWEQGAAECGLLHLSSWSSKGHRRVKAYSGGGLLVPLLLLASTNAIDAFPDPEHRGETRKLLTLCGTEATRAAAARARILDDPANAPEALHAALHAMDESRLVAMDTLQRLGKTASLPQIVAAADPTWPASVVVARRALDAMYHAASETTQRRTTELCATHGAAGFREFANHVSSGMPSPPVNSSPEAGAPDTLFRLHVLGALMLAAAALLGFWIRENARASAIRSVPATVPNDRV